MRVLVTGAWGFVGSHVTKALLARGRLVDSRGADRLIGELVLADAITPAAGVAQWVPDQSRDGAGHAAAGSARYAGVVRVRTETGDLRDPAFLRRLVGAGVDSVFHLAAALTMQAETDFVRGLEVNVHALMRLLELCRAQARPPKLVYPSSIAAFGGELPRTVDDSVVQTPQTSYGTHKSIAELLISDYSRHGFVDGRALRLPVVLVRPGTPVPAVSDRIAAIVREPLSGRDLVCPLAAGTRIPVSSARRVAESLLAIHDLPLAAFGATRAMNLPSLTVSVGDMIESVHRCAQGRRLGEVRIEPDASLQAVVDGWPAAFVSERASRWGIAADADFDEIVRAFIEECPT
jgi:nucleoside-diphosphate-sugar epimerase